MEIRIEICANSAESCLEAAKGGAYRVELCAGIPEGGTTPSLGEVKAAIEVTKPYGLKVNAIIRPRSGDFLYSELEILAMKEDIIALCAVGVDGLVWGVLTANGEVDMERNAELMECAKRANPNISTTFHRAFDVCRDPRMALERLVELGFDRILTSGQAATAVEGAGVIAKMVEQAQGRIVIMPGCGVKPENISELIKATQATEFHLSARHKVQSSMKYRHEGVSMGGSVTIEEYSNMVTSSRIVQEAVRCAQVK